MKQLFVNIVWMPTLCDQYGLNYALALMLALGLGWFELHIKNKIQLK